MTKEQEQLTLPTGVSQLLKHIRAALDEHIGRVAADGESWKLGGGTILAARWQHRTSEDLDILYHPDTDTTHFETRLGEALEAAGGRVIGWGLVSQIAFGKQHQLELMANEPVPPVGHTRAMVDSESTTVLATAQIMNGKIIHRGLDPPPRDVYDIAVCGIEAPAQLEMAVNGLQEAGVDSQLLLLKMNAQKHAKGVQTRVSEVPERLNLIKERPAPYAIRALEQALYREVRLRAENGAVEFETTSLNGKRARRYGSVEALRRGFAADGIERFLRAQRRNPREQLRRAEHALRENRQAVILTVRPDLPPERQSDLPEVKARASEGGQGTGGSGTPPVAGKPRQGGDPNLRDPLIFHTDTRGQR